MVLDQDFNDLKKKVTALAGKLNAQAAPSPPSFGKVVAAQVQVSVDLHEDIEKLERSLSTGEVLSGLEIRARTKLDGAKVIAAAKLLKDKKLLVDVSTSPWSEGDLENVYLRGSPQLLEKFRLL